MRETKSILISTYTRQRHKPRAAELFSCQN